MADLIVRIGDEYLNGDFKDGQILTHEDVNEIINILKTAVNENYFDIQKVQNGEQMVENSNKLNGATLSRAVDNTLQNDDNTIPTSQQVKIYIDSRIHPILRSIGG